MISIIICTYNSPFDIRRCLNSILNQEIDEKLEILLLDGGSDRKTLSVLKKYERNSKELTIKVIKNPAGLPEGKGRGKWLGYKKSKGRIVGFIDQDNELVKRDSVRQIVEGLDKEKKCFGAACRLYLDKKENLANQCISLIGTDPIVAYRSMDYLVSAKRVIGEVKEGYQLIEIPRNDIIITGGNCFFYKRESLNKINGYVQDVDNIFLLNKLGENKVIMLDESVTNHHAVKGFIDFIRKKRKWGAKYSKEQREFSWFPRTKEERKSFIINFWKIAFVIPLIFEQYINSIKIREPRYILTIPMYYETMIVYLEGIISNFLKSRK